MKINDSFEIVKNIKARNRIVMPPMDTLMATDGFANDFHIQHYGSRAYGGIGSIIVESTAVLSNGVINIKDLGLWNDEQVKPIAKVAKIIQQAGAVAGVQLNHAGAKADIKNVVKYGTTKKYNDHLDQTYLELVDNKILKSIEDAFVAAAKRAKTAGFNFVEIHAAHGYFLSNLIGKYSNDVIITDDILVRSATLINIIKRIHDDIKIPVGVRISFSDHTPTGMQVEDYEPLVKALDHDVEYFHVSSGETIAKGGVKELVLANGILFRIPMAEKVKKWTTKKVIVVGNFTTRNDVERALIKNIDGVALGREVLFNPNVVITDLLNSEELEMTKYHWNQNPWFDYQSYKNKKERYTKK